MTRGQDWFAALIVSEAEMAGHSQFANIMHRKGAQDKKRAKIFSRLSKEITVAAKMGSPDPEMNPRLRLAVQTARKANMPKDNIQRAIKKSQSADEANFEEMRYEGFGPGGIGMIVEALTDNKNRTAGSVRSIFTKFGGNLGETGSVGFMFDHVGSLEFKVEAGDADTVMEAAIEAGAEDCESSDDGHTIYCGVGDLNEVKDALEKDLGEAESAKLVWKPQNTIDLDIEKAQTLMKLYEALEDDDDVQSVHANFEISDEVMAELAG